MTCKRLSYVTSALFHGLWDIALRVSGWGRHSIPIVSEPDSFAAMNQPGCYAGYLSLLPHNHRWHNRCHASVLLEHALYRPTTYASRVQCPTLVVNAHFDQLIPRMSLSRMTARMPKGRLIDSWTDHFGVYTGDFAKEAAAIQLQFLMEHLKPQAHAAVDSATCSAA
jgi:hypothetical protein